VRPPHGFAHARLPAGACLIQFLARAIFWEVGRAVSPGLARGDEDLLYVERDDRLARAREGVSFEVR
jgi:hypothetical protein